MKAQSGNDLYDVKYVSKTAKLQLHNSKLNNQSFYKTLNYVSFDYKGKLTKLYCYLTPIRI